jgi:hypothetical protein
VPAGHYAISANGRDGNPEVDVRIAKPGERHTVELD